VVQFNGEKHYVETHRHTHKHAFPIYLSNVVEEKLLLFKVHIKLQKYLFIKTFIFSQIRERDTKCIKGVERMLVHTFCSSEKTLSFYSLSNLLVQNMCDWKGSIRLR